MALRCLNPADEPTVDARWEWVVYRDNPQVRRVAVPGGWVYSVAGLGVVFVPFQQEPPC